ILLATFAWRTVPPAIGRLFILAGLLLIALSATPLPIWAWCVWGVANLIWVVLLVARRKTADTTGNKTPQGVTLGHLEPTLPAAPCEGGDRTARAPVVPATVAVVACTLAAVSWELSWQVPLRRVETRSQDGKPDRQKRLMVIGDSLSAEDFTEGGDPWP